MKNHLRQTNSLATKDRRQPRVTAHLMQSYEGVSDSLNHTIEDVSVVGQMERIRNPGEQRHLLQTQGSPMNETGTSFNFQKRSKDVRTQGGRNRGYVPNTATNSTTIDGTSYEMSSANNNNPALFLQSAS